MVGLILLKCTFLLKTIEQILKKIKVSKLIIKAFFQYEYVHFFSVN